MLNNEEKYLLDKIMGKNVNIDKLEILNIDNLIKISSNHLIIPLLYTKLTSIEKEFFPKEFVEYLSNIYKINRNRNKKMKSEVIELSKLLLLNKIDHVFLKGSAMIFGNYYNDLGERMIGDIDLLVYERDTEKIKNILDINGYKTVNESSYLSNKHLRRRLKKDNLFAIEVHYKIYSGQINQDLNKIFIGNYMVKNRVKIPNRNNMLMNNILNNQLSDNSFITLNFDFRNIYDTLKIINDKKETIFKIDKTKETENYFYLLSKLGVFKKPEKLKKINYCTRARINLKFSFRVIYMIDSYVSKIYLKNLIISKKIIEFIFNNGYRAHVLRKLKHNFIYFIPIYFCISLL